MNGVQGIWTQSEEIEEWKSQTNQLSYGGLEKRIWLSTVEVL